MHTVLIVDDEASIRTSLRGILEDEGYRVSEASSGEEALTFLEKHEVSSVLLDIWMTGMDGVETLRRIRKQTTNLPVIMMSGHGTIETAVSATKTGAYDFLEKPLSLDRVLLLLERAIRERVLLLENRELKLRAGHLQPLIGHTPAMQRLKEQIGRVAPTEGWVLITGENGVGKEVTARHIHHQSMRAEAPFVTVNAAAIPERRIESELFGHEEGAFPGALSEHIGHFEQADGGTLFFDEIGDMPLMVQAKILRVLQEQCVNRVGGRQKIQVDVRVMASSNKKLREEIVKGHFREDLFHRFNVVHLRVPTLRERREDIPLFVEHFKETLRGTLPTRDFSEESLEVLKRYRWPGNVRELKNLVERLLIMTSGSVVNVEDLPEFVSEKPSESSPSTTSSSRKRSVSESESDFLEMKDFRKAREQFERAFLKRQLARHHGNVAKTAESIGVERSALYRKLKGLDLG